MRRRTTSHQLKKKEIKQTMWPPTARTARWSDANFPGWTRRLIKATADLSLRFAYTSNKPLPPTLNVAVYFVNTTISPSFQSHWATLTIDLWTLYAARVRAYAPACQMTWINTFQRAKLAKNCVHKKKMLALWLRGSGRESYFQRTWSNWKRWMWAELKEGCLRRHKSKQHY